MNKTRNMIDGRETDTVAIPKRHDRWLSEAACNVTSQCGEDGILAEALRLLPAKNAWCIEFGAWDGKYLSNTFQLVDRQHYQVVLIEGDSRKYDKLRSEYPHKDRALFFKAYVGWSEENSLDHLLAGHSVPRDPDLLSIDVDGNDYHLWQAMERIRPKLVLIEFNPTMPNCVDFVQPRDASCHQGSSPAAIVRLAKEKGYELIAATEINLLFVDEAYYHLFGIHCNSLDTIRFDRPNYVFFGFDGTVFLHGQCRLLWHDIDLSANKIQVLPPMLRKYPPAYSLVERVAFRIFLLLNHPKDGMRWLRKYATKRIGAVKW